MARRLIVLLVLSVVSSLGACDDSSEGGEGGAGDDGPLTDSELTIACPATLAVGVADSFTATIQNRGDEDWPLTYIGSDGSVDSVVNSITLDGEDPASGGGPISYGDPRDPTSPNAPTLNVYGFTSLGAGEKAKLQVRVKPEKVGNTELQFAIWGDSKKAGREGHEIPSDAPLQGCDDIPIQP